MRETPDPRSQPNFSNFDRIGERQEGREDATNAAF